MASSAAITGSWKVHVAAGMDEKVGRQLAIADDHRLVDNS